MPLSKSTESNEIAAAIRAAAVEEGFVACGIAPAIESHGFSDLVKWIDAGFAGEMDYFANRLDAYRHPRGVLAGARSVVALVYPYPAMNPWSTMNPSPAAKGDDEAPASVQGRVARYTWTGSDYHDVIHPKLKRICHAVRELCPEAQARGIVDTAPLMEREVAQLAGLGWRGKNTLLLNPTLGSYFFLACVLVDIELPADEPFQADHCGTCTACLDACPTDAFVGPHVLDASKCISYLTIESRGMIPEPLREGIGDWVFGCDVCQEVCPWTRKPARRAAAERANTDSAELGSAPSKNGYMELMNLFTLDDEGFRAQFRHTPMWRTRRRGLLRNAAIVLGNVGDMNCVETLLGSLQDPEPVVRASCVWAIRKILDRTDLNETAAVNEALARLQSKETEAIVLAELQ